MTQKEIAEAFSNGEFEKTFPYFSDTILWEVVGENKFTGWDEVIENCILTADYFKTVTTHFKTLNVITDLNRISVNGTAEFLKDNKRVAFVSACDVYEFDNESLLEKITSYCIQKK